VRRPPLLACLPALLPGLLGLSVLASLLVAPPAHAAGDAWRGTGGDIEIVGRGYGHGHGMSQWGAQGAAKQGLSSREIVEFYYPGTEAGRVGGRIGVLITADTSDQLTVLPRKKLRARAVESGRTVELDRDGVRLWRMRTDKRGRTRVASLPQGASQKGGWEKRAVFAGPGEFDARNRPVKLVLPGGERPYRGRLRGVDTGGGALDTVNRLRLEDYLRGVVPREVPALWEPAAVQAQAIAARTYAAYERAHPRSSTHHTCDTTSCQVYGGVADEHPAADAAIAETARQVRTADGEPAFTQFSSSSGGWTSQGSRDYLPAQKDPYDGWDGNPVHRWSATVPAAAVERAWPAVGSLRSIEVVARDGQGQWGGRATRVRVVGTAGERTVTGPELRFALGLRSEWLAFR